MMKSVPTVLLLLIAGILVVPHQQQSVYAAASAAQQQGQSMATPNTNSTRAADLGPVKGPGGDVYENNCAVCHGEHLEGNLPGFPPLVGIHRQLTDEQITDLVHHGKGRMPAFAKLSADEMSALLRFIDSTQPAETAAASSAKPGRGRNGLVQTGNGVFQQNCAFCHGRDAGGGETGPDLTRSKLVGADKEGDKISEVVREGRPQKGMPHFTFSEQEMAGLVAYIHDQRAKATNTKGGRRGVDVSDLQTGNLEEGKRYFQANCASCHSPTGDLAGVATRFEGLELERRMLYPEDAKSKVTVTLPGGEKIAGTLAYLDEFTVGLRDASGTYRSWPTPKVKYVVDAPVEAHVQLFSKYTDADIHNLMAFIQTLK